MSDVPVVMLALGPEVDPRPCLESLLQTGHGEFIVALGEGISAALVAALSARAAVTVLPSPPPLPERAQPGAEPPTRLLVCAHALRSLPAGRRFACLATDLLVQRPLVEAWAEARPAPFGLAIPRWTPERLLSFNPKVILGHGGAAVAQELGLIAADVRRIQERTAALYGGVLPAAFARAAARSDEGGGTIVARLPETWCQASATADVVDLPSGAPAIGARRTALIEAWEAAA